MTPTAWWLERAPRERMILGVGAVLAGLLLFFLLVWAPLYDALAAKQAERDEARELAAWLTEIRPEVRGAARGGGVQGAKRSLLSVVDGAARRAQLAEAVKRIQPDGDNTVRVWVEDAPLEELMRWVLQLQTQNGIRVSALNLDRGDASGTASARLTLER